MFNCGHFGIKKQFILIKNITVGFEKITCSAEKLVKANQRTIVRHYISKDLKSLTKNANDIL